MYNIIHFVEITLCLPLKLEISSSNLIKNSNEFSYVDLLAKFEQIIVVNDKCSGLQHTDRESP